MKERDERGSLFSHRAAREVCGRPITLLGKFDRVDKRDGTFTILDYKSGSIPKFAAKVWSNDELWQRLAAWAPTGAEDPLPDLAKALPDIQLPCYAMILENHLKGRRADVNAAWVNLAEDGKEVPLFQPGKHDIPAILGDTLPTVFDFLLRHLIEAPAFTPQAGRHCEWCPYKSMCH